MDIGLDDPEGISYLYDKNELVISVKTWNLKKIKFKFTKVMFFLDWGASTHMSKLYQSSPDLDVHNIKLEKSFDYKNKLLNDAGYKIFQFVDSNDNPVFEIICLDLELINEFDG